MVEKVCTADDLIHDLTSQSRKTWFNRILDEDIFHFVLWAICFRLLALSAIFVASLLKFVACY